MADAYLKNRTAIGPTNDEGIIISPKEAYLGIKPSIDYIRIWGCQCYSYIDLKSLLAGGRYNKFINKGKKGIFIGYDENTIKQRWIYAPDLRYYTKSSRIKFNEDSKGSDLELRLRLPTISNSDIINSNGILNELPIRNPKGRPKLQSKYQSNLKSNLDLKSNLRPNLDAKPKLEPQLD